MQSVYKYALDLGLTSVEMPKDADILSVKEQRGQLFVWALVNPASPMEKRQIEVFGTGHPIRRPADDLHYIGHVTQGPFEWHVFEIREGAIK